MNDLDGKLKKAKQASFEIAKLTAKNKATLLLTIAATLRQHKNEILEANALDVSQTKEKGASSAFIDRLTLSEKGFAGMISQLETVAHLPEVLDEVIEERTLTNGVLLKKERFPLGLIAMIYESRPNVTVDAVGLCLKAGNAVILKGGSEAAHTNRMLVHYIHEVLTQHQISQAAVTLLDKATHADIDEMLTRNDVIDVVIPRGSYALTTAVANKSRIPILYHSAGGARMYVDKSADIEQALEICVNAKTNRTGVCNALDMVLVHKEVAEKFLKKLDEVITAKGFEIRADARAREYMPNAKQAAEKDFSTEFLDTILAVKIVDDAPEAIQFIKTHTHGHTEILATKDEDIVNTFIHEIDAAGLMINCSSRLHDGGEFEMGAEMGTATGKLHARGPVGVRELTTYKWIAFGNGQIKQ